MSTKDFIKYFGLAELKSIAGKRYINVWILSGIIFIALIAIGLGKSSTTYLKEKMDSPFIKFVNITIPYGQSADLEEFKKEDIKKKFGFEEYQLVYEGYINLQTESKHIINAKLREANENSEFFRFLVENDKVMLTNQFFNDDKYNCIVTEDLLKRLSNKNLEYPYIYMEIVQESFVPIKITGVVKELPNYTDILVSPKVYNAIINKIDVQEINKNYLEYFIPDIEKIDEDIKEIGFTQKEDEELLSNQGIVIINNNINDCEVLESKVLNAYPKARQIFDLNRLFVDHEVRKREEFVSFSFNHLDSISSFRNYIKDQYKLDIDMNEIEAKQNFNFFNKLSILLSFSLITFSIIVIFIFIINIIINHIEKNKQNLGTLKAFGLNNNVIINLYTLISVSLIAIAFIIAYFSSYIFGSLSLNFLLDLVNIHVDQNIYYMNLPLYILSLFFLGIPTIIIYFKLRRSLVNATPGDLIYNR